MKDIRHWIAVLVLLAQAAPVPGDAVLDRAIAHAVGHPGGDAPHSFNCSVFRGDTRSLPIGVFDSGSVGLAGAVENDPSFMADPAAGLRTAAYQGPAVVGWLLPAVAMAAGGTAPCRIEVVEKGSGWPVPLVELRTTHSVRFVSDNAGRIAFDLSELMGRETWFDVIGHGYEVPKDGFGQRGVRLEPEPGGALRVEVQRTIVARRMGRLTGGGLFAESAALGMGGGGFESGILGCDSVQNAEHRGRLFWLWGDTTIARYPLGIFHSTGAMTPVRALESFEPPLRLRFEYFADATGAPRAIAQMAGRGPTWVNGCVSLKDKTGTPRLGGCYAKIKPPLETYECGLCVWNDDAAKFEPLRVLWKKSAAAPEEPPAPHGHAAFWTDAKGKPWVLFGNPFPTLRCPATFEAWQDPATWETVEPQKTVAAADGGEAVRPHTGAIAWHPWRKRWVTVFMQHSGRPSPLGELWYAEAAAPAGPWGPAVKVLSHENYTFYNPSLHPEFAPTDSPMLFFEGTYTVSFSSNKQPTPRYDYNQVLYRLDLDDPALAAAGKP